MSSPEEPDVPPVESGGTKAVTRCRDLLLLSSLILLAAACGPGGTEADQDELVLLCGSSFTAPVEELIAAFSAQTGIVVVPTVAGSEDFLPLIKAGQKGDILVTHDPFLDYVSEAHALADHAHVGDLAPVLAVRAGNPENLTALDDLARPGLDVALPNPEYSTCGEMVFALLEKKAIQGAVLANVGNRLTKGHSTLGTYLKTGVVDAAIMWNGVAHNFAGTVDIVPTPYEYATAIRVLVIGLSYSDRPDLVKRFVDFAREEGPPLFERFGYVKQTGN